MTDEKSRRGRHSAFRLGISILVSLVALCPVTATSQPRTVGVIDNDPRAAEGYVLFTPIGVNETYLIDNDGRVVHTWFTPTPGISAYLLENGALLQSSVFAGNVNPTFNSSGIIQELDWQGQLQWEFLYSSETHLYHHDFAPLPNGNLVFIAWELKTREEAIAAGRNPALLADSVLWSEKLVEIVPSGPNSGTVVWEWHVWDHLVQEFDSTRTNYGPVADFPRRIDLNYVPRDIADWLHFNAVDYSEALDQLVISVPRFGEIWVIDHSTTAEEARSSSGGRSDKGGDLLFRWGNPEAYATGRQEDKVFYFQHDARWLEATDSGNPRIMVFNNGQGRLGTPYSSVNVIEPVIDSNGDYAMDANGRFAPDELVWQFASPDTESFYSPFISGAHRLPNGNTFICSGANGLFLEVTEAGDVVWRYVNPATPDGRLAQFDPVPKVNGRNINLVFRATRYPPDYPGLAGWDLTPGATIERDPTTGVNAPGVASQFAEPDLKVFPNPFNPQTSISFTLSQPARISLAVYNLEGRKVREFIARQTLGAGEHVVKWDGRDTSRKNAASGIYFAVLRIDGRTQMAEMLLIK